MDEELEELGAQVLAMFERVDKGLPNVVLTPAQARRLLVTLGVSPENVDALMSLTPPLEVP